MASRCEVCGAPAIGECLGCARSLCDDHFRTLTCPNDLAERHERPRVPLPDDGFTTGTRYACGCYEDPYCERRCALHRNTPFPV